MAAVVVAAAPAAAAVVEPVAVVAEAEVELVAADAQHCHDTPAAWAVLLELPLLLLAWAVTTGQ